MSAFFGAEVPIRSEPGEQAEETESERLEKRKQVAASVYQDMKLHELAPNDEMYYAMENFLLGDPKRQIEELGTEASIMEKGEQARTSGNNLMARVNYETAAKIAIYNQNKQGVINSIKLARGVTEKSDHISFQDTILDNVDEVMRIAREYYSETVAAQQ